MANTIQRLSTALPNEIIIEKIIYGNQGVHPEGDSGMASYFDLVIQDNSNSGLLNGKFDGFCIDTDRSIDFELDNNLNGVIDFNEVGTSYTAKVYSSYDLDGLQNAGLVGTNLIEKPENLDSVNWLINNFANSSVGNIQDVNFADVQRAIWTLIDDRNSTTFLTDFSGNPLWNDTRVNSIVDLARTQGENFVPEFGQKMAVVLVPDDHNNDGSPDAQIVITAVELSKLGDRVFLDSNADGIQDNDEVGISGVTVNLLADINGDGVIGNDEIIDTTTTDANGEYHFTVIAGDYKVSFERLENYEVSPVDRGDDDAIDSDGLISDIITLAPGEINPTIDNGFFQKAGLGDFVWEDANANGIQDAGELGVQGVTVTLTGGGADGIIGNADDTTATTVTDVDGLYRFIDLNPGEEYKVTFSDLPTDFVFTQQDTGSNDAVDSDANPLDGMTQTVILASGEFNSTLDAGIYQLTPGIEIEKFVNGIDADLPEDAVEIAPGEDVTFTYEVINTGNVAFAANEIVLTDDNGTPNDYSDDFNPAFNSGDSNNNNILDPGETWLYSETQTARDLATVTTTVIDFETDGFGNLLAAGDIIDTEYQNLGLTISATQYGAMIFDSANPTGGDSDLSIPGLDNILIISEDGNSSEPDDNAHGGTITFTLDNPVNIRSIDLVDIEETGGTVVTTDINGEVTSTPINNPGDNSFQTLMINDSNVTEVEVNLAGSGAISGLEFDETAPGIYKNMGKVVVNNLMDSDPAHYVNPTPEPNINIEKFVNGIDAAHPSEFPALHPGSHVTFTYEVTNTGNVPFAANEVVVTDDNGTANNLSDDFNPSFTGGDDGNDILDPGETWTYSATDTVQNLNSAIYEETTFVFTGDSYLDGANGNVRSFTQNDVSVDVSGFSYHKHSGTWHEAYVGVYSNGLGVTNVYENTNAHRTDNRGSIDFLVFEFDTDVIVDKALLKSVGYDSDISLWIGDRDITGLDSDLLDSFSKENNFTNHGSSRWANVNHDELVGDTLIVSAYTGGCNDSFKLHKLDLEALTGNDVGIYQNVATVDTGLASDSDFSGYVNSLV